MKKTIPIYILAISLTACVSTPKVPGQGADRPTAIINTKSTAAVVQKLTELCDRNGMFIEDSGASSVTCSKDAPMAAAVFLQTAYGTPLKSRVRFNTFPVQGGIKIATNVWYETQNALGQIDRTDINGGRGQEVLHRILRQAKTEIEGNKK